ncbi:hypothetical protein EAO75_43755 [Streptomyces sp. uw30]|nr:hypothetical protein EAO75_43755 [Streptomyces sp. uw30]
MDRGTHGQRQNGAAARGRCLPSGRGPRRLRRQVRGGGGPGRGGGPWHRRHGLLQGQLRRRGRPGQRRPRGRTREHAVGGPDAHLARTGACARSGGTGADRAPSARAANALAG